MHGEVKGIRYNWHSHPESGMNFEHYVVGDSYLTFGGQFVTVTKIEIVEDNGLHAIIYFDNKTFEEQWNINKIYRATT